ncbi:MFS transporter [Dysgonomonas sp. BGC7]|uniref:MFS transporter n=1 Tax=Dysgonomonas sp. BGC7 TaxID=1658008 RepID=UPI000682E96E|nr:MFS transporter [Dysgonomonas sp. BGC7]MBD8389114.1 MFS transporter [Dysgonomonas sp. BGC7]
MEKVKSNNIYPWIVVGLLWVVALLNYMDRQMLSTMRVPMMGDIQELESAANFGRLMAVFLWIYGLMSPISGIIADKLSKKWLIVGSLAVWSGVTYLMGYTTEFSQLYILRGIMGVSEALYLPAALALIAEYHSRTRSLAVGIHMTGLYAGQALGGFGATIAAMYTWHTTFHWFGIIGVVYSLFLALFLKDLKKELAPQLTINKPKEKKMLFSGVAMLLTNVSFWVILLYFCIPSLPGWATKNWLPTLFSNNLSIDMSSAGPMSTITIAAASFVGVIFGGFLSDRWILKNIRGRIYTSAIGVFLLIPSLILIGFGHTILTVMIGAILFGVGFGMFDANNMPILCQFVPSRYRATAYGIMNMAGVFAGATITGILGKSMDSGNLGRDFALMAGIVFIVLLIQLAFLRPKVVDMTDGDE